MKKIALVFFVIILILIAFSSKGQFSFLPYNLSQMFSIAKNINQPKSISNPSQVVPNIYSDSEAKMVSTIERSLSSVVTVAINKTTTTKSYIQGNPFDPFSDLRIIPESKQNIEKNIGSGFIISSDGLIVTNKHVVADENASYKVITNDEKTYEVKAISRDPLNDLAIIKISAKDLPFLSMGDSNSLKLGQSVIAIGTPLGEFKNTVTTGIISGLGRGIDAGSPFESSFERLDNVIQTDAAINPGNSGGPLLNSSGAVIGVNTAVSGEGQNIGFAIPSNIILELVNNFNANGGKISRPMLGIRYRFLTKKQALLFELPEGVFVDEVVEGSAAQIGGLKEEDVITTIDGEKLKADDERSLAKIISKKRVGDTIKLDIFRDGNRQTLNIVLKSG